ncbi:DUF1569 domain-containing protein [Maribacter forsetii]|uniref:DUF1569 domain-containing protein n=1 Tax=Maribacter forsetii TaxID=444515 RepID=UPI0005603369|nr:DUF1569 domain-containing protein [Maribacter forsetii]
MKTIFDKNTNSELIERIQNLKESDSAKWGKMNSYQMLKHCTLGEEMFQGKKQYKRLYIGKLFGRMALKGIIKNELPMKKNQPTHPELKISSSGDFDSEKQKWISLLNDYNGYSNTNFIHPFFGKMTNDEIGIFVYKHTDHHLKQFNR